MAIIAQVRAFEHINFNKNCGVDEFSEDFLAPDAAMHPETESGRFACAKRPYLAGAEGLEPSTKVLETHVLPLHHAPMCRQR